MCHYADDLQTYCKTQQCNSCGNKIISLPPLCYIGSNLLFACNDNKE